MFDTVHDRDSLKQPSEIREVPCCVCRKPVKVRGDSFRDHWASHEKCWDKVMRGEVNEITFYDSYPNKPPKNKGYGRHKWVKPRR